MTQPRNVYRLSCQVQDYDWGKQGTSSLVARLAPSAKGPAFVLDEDKFYAELWVGTHPNAASELYSSTFSPVPATAVPLHDLLKHNGRQLLGEKILRKWPESQHQFHLPYLFKVLSIAKALPLQAHPDRKLGEKLHKQDSESYVDENHKPEIAVVIGDEAAAERIPFEGAEEKVGFTGFVGFRSVEDVAAFVRDVPELKRAIGDEKAADSFISKPSKEGLKEVWTALLQRGKENEGEVAKEVEALVKRLKSGDEQKLKDVKAYARLVEKVNEQYKGDVGVLAATFFMNFVQLKAGDAIWIPADDVHAYLEGDIIECMAVSDNVVNASFVPPEQRDVHTFSSMLNYSNSHPASHWACPTQSPYKHSQHGHTTAYRPPLDEFVVLGTKLGPPPSTNLAENASVTEKEVLGRVGGPTCGIVTKGRVMLGVEGEEGEQDLDMGTVMFVAPEKEITVRPKILGGRAEIWWATCFDA